MSHFYGQSTVSGGSVVQGNVESLYQHDEIHNHHYHYPKTSAESISTVLDWLSSLNFATTLQYHCNKRTAGTGEWLLAHPTFQRWRSGGNGHEPVLWCRGNPGSGKTVLCSMVIESLRKAAAEKEAVIYCFFDYARRQDLSADAIIADLLCQLCRKRPSAMEPLVRQLHGQAEGGRRRPTLAELSWVFQSACKAFVKVFVVTDALDESEHRVRRQFISSLNLTASPNVALLLMSRPHIQISGYLSEMFTEIEIQAQDSDLRLFLDSRIADSEDLEWVLGSRESGMKMITDQIIKNAASSFLAAEMRLNSVQYALTPAELSEALQNGLNNLSELYNDTIERIKTQQGVKAHLAIDILGWLARVKRPLTGRELCHAIALQKYENGDSWQQAPAIETILNSCQGLVTQDRHTEQVRLLHYTLLEYLEQQGNTVTHDYTILESCLKCLSTPELSKLSFAPKTRQSTIASVHLQIMRTLPFVLYATEYWTAHVQEDCQDIRRLLGYLLNQDKLGLWNQLVEFHVPNTHKQLCETSRGSMRRVTSGLRIALSMGWVKVLSVLLERVKATSSEIGHLLYAAVRSKSLQGTEIWPPYGVDATLYDKAGPSALQHPGTTNAAAMIPLLMRHSADPLERKQAREHQAPVIEGLTQRTNSQIVIQVLATGAETTYAHWSSTNTLHLAVRYRQITTITEAILNNKDSLNVQNRNGDTLLHIAIKAQDYDVAKDLVARGADCTVINHKGELAIFPLVSSVSQRGLLDKCLLHNPDFGGTDSDGRTMLHHAILQRQPSRILSFLLQHASLCKVQDAWGDTPLHLAVRNCQIDIVESLLEHGAQVDTRNNKRCTALHVAMENCPVDIIESLIRYGAGIDVRNERERTPLHLALVHKRPVDFVMMLLHYGARADVQDSWGGSALQAAAHHPHCDTITELLLQHGADVNLTDGSGDTILHQALSRRVSRPFLELLIHHGADVNKANKAGSTALHLSVQHNTPPLVPFEAKSFVRFLIDHGADILARDKNGDTSMHVLVKTAHERTIWENQALVRLLWDRDHGAKAKNLCGEPPWYIAWSLASPEAQVSWLNVPNREESILGLLSSYAKPTFGSEHRYETDITAAEDSMVVSTSQIGYDR